MGAYDCDCINNLEYERSKRREKLFHITPQKQNGCILTEFGNCSYNETGCSDCAIKAKIKNALSAQPDHNRPHWIISSDGYYPYCSECKSEPKNGEMTDFCPNCGADMRGGERE